MEHWSQNLAPLAQVADGRVECWSVLSTFGRCNVGASCRRTRRKPHDLSCPRRADLVVEKSLERAIVLNAARYPGMGWRLPLPHIPVGMIAV